MHDNKYLCPCHNKEYPKEAMRKMFLTITYFHKNQVPRRPSAFK